MGSNSYACAVPTGSSSETERLGLVFKVGMSPVKERPLRCPFFFSPSTAETATGLSTSLGDATGGTTAVPAVVPSDIADGAAAVVGAAEGVRLPVAKLSERPVLSKR